MPRTQTVPVALPPLQQSLYGFIVEELKWYAAVLPGVVPKRKDELVAYLHTALSDPAQLQALWGQLTPAQQAVIADVVHTFDGRYEAGVLPARHKENPKPNTARGYYSYGYGQPKTLARPFDLFFAHNYEVGTYIPPDLAERLRAMVPPPPPPHLDSTADVPTLRGKKRKGDPAQHVINAEGAIFHDLTATLDLVAQGKISVSAASRLPTLPTLRLVRGRLLIADYFADEYTRAEDAIRPLALVVLVQAAGWAAPAGAAGTKLDLTKTGQERLDQGIGAAQVRTVWERWLKSDLLDELTRVRAIKGQQSKLVRLTKPAERRAKLVAALGDLPLDQWVTFDEFLRYLRAGQQLPTIERNQPPALRIGAYISYDPDLGYNTGQYWDVIVGSYLRAVVWEYVATLGLVELAYTRPEDTPHDFGDIYGLLDESLSRYDGLVAMRLTALGAYVLGLTRTYTPPDPALAGGPPVVRVLPNLDVVVTDPLRLLPNDRALLARIGAVQSDNVYRLNRESLLDAVQNGLSLEAVAAFLAARSGSAEADLPGTVRVFLADLGRRLAAVREGGRMVVLEADDPYLLTELANDSALRGLVQSGRIGDRPVLLVAEEHEAAARRQLKKLGYVPRK